MARQWNRKAKAFNAASMGQRVNIAPPLQLHGQILLNCVFLLDKILFLSYLATKAQRHKNYETILLLSGLIYNEFLIKDNTQIV